MNKVKLIVLLLCFSVFQFSLVNAGTIEPDDPPVEPSLGIKTSFFSTAINEGFFGAVRVAFSCSDTACDSISARLLYCAGSTNLNCTPNILVGSSGGITTTASNPQITSTSSYDPLNPPDVEWYIKGVTRGYYRLKVVATSPPVEPVETPIKLVYVNALPVVNLTEPNGDSVCDSFNIQWTASDWEGSPLTFTLKYYKTSSPTQIYIIGSPVCTGNTAVGISCSYLWDMSSFDSTTYKVFVIANDGKGTTESNHGQLTKISKPSVSINKLDFDTSSPYVDHCYNSTTNLLLNVSSSTGLNQCKYSTSSFNPETQGTVCTTNSSTLATCYLGNLGEGSYTRYFACKDNATCSGSSNWSNVGSINFTVQFPYPNPYVTSVAGDSSAPYFDYLNDKKTYLVLGIPSYYASQCKYSTSSSFNPASQGTSCSMSSTRSNYCGSYSPSIATCNIANGTLYDGSYSYYYSCYNPVISYKWTPNRRVDFTVDFISPLTASILSPSVNNWFLIGSGIDFSSSVYSNFFDYTVVWDSNVDVDWKRTTEAFSSSDLSIADHEITFNALIEYDNPADTKIITKTDSVSISVVPIPRDALNIAEFTVAPNENLVSNSIVQVNATIINYDELRNAKAVLKIINAETGIKLYDSVVLNELIAKNDSKSISVPLDFSAIGLTEGTYKINLDLVEYLIEQNTSNNSRSQIITVLEKEPEEIRASELSVLIIPLMLISILVILTKKETKVPVKKIKKK